MKRTSKSTSSVLLGCLMLLWSAVSVSADWAPTGSMGTARHSHTVTMLQNGKILVAGGFSEVPVTNSELFDPADGTFEMTGTLQFSRSDHAAVRLLDGTVLAVGGLGNGVQSTAEIYDPITGTWADTGSLTFPRRHLTATLLHSGEVLVTGGFDELGQPVAATEIYSPGTGSWTTSGALSTARFYHTATRLQTGEVVVAGGRSDSMTSLNSVEVFDPGTGSWSPGGTLDTARSRHTATLLPFGGILLVAGVDEGNSLLRTVEEFDPLARTSQEVAALPAADDGRVDHVAALLATGNVLIAGGEGSAGVQTTVRVYTPGSNSWQISASMGIARALHNALLLPSGDVLVTGGRNVTGGHSSAEVYSPSIGAVSMQGPNLPTDTTLHTATLLSSGDVLVAGGNPGDKTKTEVTYNRETNLWTIIDQLDLQRHSHTATRDLQGRVVVAGGDSGNGPTDSVEILDPTAAQWAPAGTLCVARFNHTATLLPSGSILFVGGENGFPIDETEIYDPITEECALVSPLNDDRTKHTASELPTGEVLVAGGFGNAGALKSVEIYDFKSGTWSSPPNGLNHARYDHAVASLQDGRIMVIGGRDNSGDIDSAEIYDPDSGTWSLVSSLNSKRDRHTATLLPSGKVLVFGKSRFTGSPFEVYDPATNSWADEGGSGSTKEHTATLLATGEVLMVGGVNFGGFRRPQTVLFAMSESSDDRKPTIGSIDLEINPFEAMSLTGNLFGDSEASQGNSRNSSVSDPLIKLSKVGGPSNWLIPDPVASYAEDPLTMTVSSFPADLRPGMYIVNVVTGGNVSDGKIVHLSCGLRIVSHPSDVTAPIGSQVTFTAAVEGANSIQWQRNGINLPEANGPTYTTPPLTLADSGSTYRVIVGNDCGTDASRFAELTVVDGTGPFVRVDQPKGGDYWLLTDDNETEPRIETISWSMADDARICRVEVSLLFSNDGGQTYEEVNDGGLPAMFGSGAGCPEPGVDTTSLEYTLPVDPPSGTSSSLYEVEVRVTDFGGETETARSGTFYMVRPNSESVRTLIVSNVERMREEMGLTDGQVTTLRAKLHELADHPRVQGRVIDLGSVASIANLYSIWDADRVDFNAANDVLFQSGGIHAYLQELLALYVGVEHLVLVGDDRIIPMARLEDRTAFRESIYTSGMELTPTGTTVGQALAANQYLSDDPLAIAGPLNASSLNSAHYIPDYAIGRLVENPEEIVTAIATFISQDGVLDLSALDPDTGHKVLVTGYDFLRDVAKVNRFRWKKTLNLPQPFDDDEIAPVDGQLISRTWGQPTADGRRVLLRTHLSGHGLDRYGVMNVNGHATHFELGVPGVSLFDIQGLPTIDIYGTVEGCEAPSLGAVDLAGGVLYGTGCHSGLTVAGSCPLDGENSLDLPQTMMARGVQAYLGNTGYGWGLLSGVGLSERMVEIFTEEMTRGGTVVIGELVNRSKLRYFLESPRFDSYDVKTSMQWTLFGLPMYAVRTGIASSPSASLIDEPVSRARPNVETVGPVTVKRSVDASLAALPAYLTRLDLRFDFAASGVYQKRNASGDAIPDGTIGCPCPAAGEPEGCYYTLNDLVERATDEPDLPLQPYFVYDSRLSGTSQHSVLWMGASYDEEPNWVPVFGELVTNGGDFSEHGVLPSTVYIPPSEPRRRILGDEADCRPSDNELNSVVLTTGEAVRNDDGTWTQRLHRGVDLEVFYFNNTIDSHENCDRTGPLLGDGPYHSVTGRTVSWNVPVTSGDTWRVVVVYNDETAKRWAPVELSDDDGDGTWTGNVRVEDFGLLTYFVQAVDLRGNVTWVEYEPAQLPPSGLAPEIPEPFDALVVLGLADLAAAVVHAPDPVMSGDPLTFTLTIDNSTGPDSADTITVELPSNLSVLNAWGTGWSCSITTVWTCSRDLLDAGSSATITVLADAPLVGGVYGYSFTMTSASDPNLLNDTAVTEILVIDDTMTDLAVFKEDGGAAIVPGGPITWSITVTNLGPNPVAGAEVRDYFPGEVHSVTWWCEAATVGSSCADGVGVDDLVDTVSLLPQGTLVYHATAVVADGVSGPITNEATVEVPAPMVDYNPPNDRAAVTTSPPSMIFTDGFESGGTSNWSDTVGSAPENGE